MSNRQVMLLLSDDLYNDVEENRWRMRVSRSEFIRRAVTVYIDVLGANLPAGTIVQVERPGLEPERVQIAPLSPT